MRIVASYRFSSIDFFFEHMEERIREGCRMQRLD